MVNNKEALINKIKNSSIISDTDKSKIIELISKVLNYFSIIDELINKLEKGEITLEEFINELENIINKEREKKEREKKEREKKEKGKKKKGRS